MKADAPRTDAQCIERITDYLISGGLWNPELAIHDNVRDLLIDCREELAASKAEVERLTKEGELYRSANADVKRIADERNRAEAEVERLKDVIDWSASLMAEIGRELTAQKIRDKATINPATEESSAPQL